MILAEFLRLLRLFEQNIRCRILLQIMDSHRIEIFGKDSEITVHVLVYKNIVI